MSTHELDWSHFLEGQIVGLFFLVGSILSLKGLATGPGGPVNALNKSQILYQTGLNACFFDQGLSSYELSGIGCGLMATLMITLGDFLIGKLCPV